jgi:hypothetical protein
MVLADYRDEPFTLGEVEALEIEHGKRGREE